MKCYVCSKTYEGSECPRCHFPAIQVPNATWEQARQSLTATIEPFLANFLKSIRAELTIYYHKDENGVCALDHEDLLSLGTGTELYKNELWNSQQFARLADQDSVPVRLRLTVGDQSREEKVMLPNLHAAALQQIGITLDEQFRFHLKLRNGTEAPTASQPVEL